MSYIIKNTAALINTLMTDAARKKISQGKFDIAYFQVGDSEVCYNCVNGMNIVDYNVLMPQYNAQSLTPVPQKNRMHVKYPLYIDSTSGSTFGVPFDNSYIDNVYNSAAPRGFFTGNTTGSPITYSAYTSSAFTINPNFFVDNTTMMSGNVITLSATTIDPSVSGTVTPGMFLTLFTTDSTQPLTASTPMFTYLVVAITGDTSTGSTVTIQVDRNIPNFSSVGLSGNSSVLFYPSGMTELYDTFTPEPFWALDVLNFETNCDVSQRDVYVWNMNIPWTESPAGLFSNTYQDYNLFKSTGYTNTKEYLGYKTNAGQIDTDSTYYYNSFSEKITVEPVDQKAIAIVHYTNQSIDNFYGEKFAMEDYDPANPGNTGQARNFKITIPWLMWHKNPNATIGEEFYTDPSGFTSQNLFEVHYIKSTRDQNFNTPGLRYYHLWDTHANTNGIPNRVGKVFPDLKLIVFDDDEIVAALNYKSNRSWTLPAPKLGLVTPNTFNGVLGGTVGLLTGNTESLFLTYILTNTGFTNSLHCNYYTEISGNDQTLLPGASDIIIRFGNEFPFLQDNSSLIPSGFTANNIKILAQKVPSGTTRPSSTLWREIDVYDQISATTVNNYLNTSGLTGTTIQLTKNMYDTASFYNLNNYIQLPQVNATGLTLNFGGEYYFFGNIQTDIQATIYVMNFLCNLGQTQFFDSSNPTWDGVTTPYVTEVALYNADKELMVISKIQSPEKRQGIQQYPIKLDF
jgi:hypothetical protein